MFYCAEACNILTAPIFATLQSCLSAYSEE